MSRLIERARALMERPGAWVDQVGDRYPLRLGQDRRNRVLLMLDEPSFQALTQSPGLKTRCGGGWQARSAQPVHASDQTTPPPGRPGMIDGTREVILPTGQIIPLKANLGESPILWLARRKDASGRPWLTPAEIAAGERLRSEAEQAISGARLTMSWDATPLTQKGSNRPLEPNERALNASQNVRLALAACSPRLRPMLEQVCIHGSSLTLAEQRLDLRRRQGKTLLKQGLQELADHYGFQHHGTKAF